jgi:hypothetical protein
MPDIINSNLVNEALSTIISTTAQAKDFILSEAPDVVSQLLVYNLAINVAYLVISVLIILVYAKYMHYLFTDEGDLNEFHIPLSMFSGAAVLITFCITIFETTPELLKLWLAPKVWLIEYAAALVN